MLIGIDASRANREQLTGVEWYGFHLIQEMKKFSIFNLQFSIRFVLYSDEPLRGELAKLPPNWTSKVLKWQPKRLWTQVRLSWEMLRNPPDVLFIPSHVFPIIHPRKTVMTIHDIAAARFPESYDWFSRWYTVWSARSALKKLRRMIVPSEFVKKELLELRNYRIEELQKKMYVVPHGYDLRYKRIENKIEIEERLKKYNIQKPFIMSVGRLEEKKNTARIIKAFNNLKSVIASEAKQSDAHEIALSSALLPPRNDRLQLLLVGRLGHGYEKVKTAIENSPFKNDIITPGWVRPEDIPYLMNAAEVFVFPSLYEGFGLPALEAMACGLPVVASRGSSLEEVGADAALYVDPTKSEEIATAIRNLLTDDVLRREKIWKGLERVKAFAWEKCARETLAVLKQ